MILTPIPFDDLTDRDDAAVLIKPVGHTCQCDPLGRILGKEKNIRPSIPGKSSCFSQTKESKTGDAAPHTGIDQDHSEQSYFYPNGR